MCMYNVWENYLSPFDICDSEWNMLSSIHEHVFNGVIWIFETNNLLQTQL